MKKRNDSTASSGNVFVDLGFDEIEAEELSLRAFLMTELREIIRQQKFTQKQIAEKLRIDQPRVSKLLAGQMSRFSTDKLISYLLRIGYNVSVQVNTDSTRKQYGRVTFSGFKRKTNTQSTSRRKSA